MWRHLPFETALAEECRCVWVREYVGATRAGERRCVWVREYVGSTLAKDRSYFLSAVAKSEARAKADG